MRNVREAVTILRAEAGPVDLYDEHPPDLVPIATVNGRADLTPATEADYPLQPGLQALRGTVRVPPPAPTSAEGTAWRSAAGATWPSRSTPPRCTSAPW